MLGWAGGGEAEDMRGPGRGAAGPRVVFAPAEVGARGLARSPLAAA